MFKPCYGIALCLLLGTPVLANDAPPSDESIETLLDPIDARQLIEAMKTQVDASLNETMQRSLEQALEGKTLTARQRAIIDGKMPALLHNMLDEYQGMLQPLQQQFLQIARETAQELEQPDPTPANNTG